MSVASCHLQWPFLHYVWASAMYESSCCPAPLSSLAGVHVFILTTQCVNVNISTWFWFAFTGDKCCWASSVPIPFVIHISSLVKCLFRYFACFFNWLLWWLSLLLCSFQSSLHIQETCTLSHIWLVNISSQFWLGFFHQLKIVILKAKYFN